MSDKKTRIPLPYAFLFWYFENCAPDESSPSFVKAKKEKKITKWEYCRENTAWVSELDDWLNDNKSHEDIVDFMRTFVLQCQERLQVAMDDYFRICKTPVEIPRS